MEGLQTFCLEDPVYRCDEHSARSTHTAENQTASPSMLWVWDSCNMGYSYSIDLTLFIKGGIPEYLQHINTDTHVVYRINTECALLSGTVAVRAEERVTH